MLEAVSLFIICLITHVLDCYIFSKLINEKFRISVKNVILIIVLTIFDYTIGISCNGYIRILITNMVTYILLKIIYNKTISQTLVGTLLLNIGYAIIELLYAAISYLIFQISNKFIFDMLMGMILSNCIIFIMCIIFFNIKYVCLFFGKIINWCTDKKIVIILSNIIISCILCAVIMYPISHNELSKNNLMLLFAVLISILLFVIGFFNEKSNNNQLTIKYDNLLDYVKDYEMEVVEKGKAIHEHKNQLAVIDGLISKNNKELKKYVSEKLDSISRLDDNVWLEKLTNLPTGGTKGLVYLKIKRMLENDISIYVDIDEELKTKSKWNNVKSNLEDYTRILGVYLDNAIEASIESKDKQIIIEFIDNKDDIEFVLSNTYNGKINFKEIDKEKYSTKGKNRGYGLSLVKDIAEKNNYIRQSREVNGKFFVQKLYIKK